MTTRLAPWCFSSLAALGLFALAPHAQAQCLPGSVFCAQVSVGGYVDVAPPPPPPPVIIAQPPPPPVVIYQPPPPPPPPMYPAPSMYPPLPQFMPPRVQRERRFGLHLDLGYMGADRVSMVGTDAGLRFRSSPQFGLEVGIGTYFGTDYNANRRVEVPLTLDALFFLNPGDRFQVYGLAGIGMSWAQTDSGTYGIGTDYTYVGGRLGIGLELRVAPFLAFNVDLRGFLRQRIGDYGAPEFVDLATGRTTNTSVGLYGTLGTTFYF